MNSYSFVQKLLFESLEVVIMYSLLFYLEVYND